MKSIIIKLLPCLLIALSYCKSEDKSSFVDGSGVLSIKLTSEKTGDLFLLGKVWGFLKYYHPVVVSGKFNWDYELFKILPKVLACKNKDERNEILSLWIDDLGPIGEDTVYKIDSTKVKSYPNLNWIKETSSLGNDLSGKLIAIKNAIRTYPNYYVHCSEVGTSFTNEDPYKQFKCPDVGYRLLCLFRYWNAIQYFYPDKHLIGENWENVLIEFIPKFVNDSNRQDYESTVFEIVARIHDSHSCPMSLWINYLGNYIAPIKLAFIENQAIVTGYYDESYGKTSELKIGDVILKIKNKSLDDFVRKAPSNLRLKLPYSIAEHCFNIICIERFLAEYYNSTWENYEINIPQMLFNKLFQFDLSKE